MNRHLSDSYWIGGDTIEKIDILLSFYNLQVDPNLSDSGKSVLNRRDLRRIKRFLDEYAPGVFFRIDEVDWNWDEVYPLKKKIGVLLEMMRDLIFGIDLDIQQVKEEIRELAKEEINRVREVAERDDYLTFFSIIMTTTLERYENKTDCNWFQSGNLKTFMKDYLMVQCIIDDFMLGRFDYEKSKRWLSSLLCELVDIKTKLLKDKSVIISDSELFFFLTDKLLMLSKSDSISQQSKYRDINSLFFSDPNQKEYCGDWHGIGIYHIGQAIYDGLFLILRQEVIIRRCAVEGCNRIFRIKMRGGSKKTYCRESCKKKASKLRNLHTENENK